MTTTAKRCACVLAIVLLFLSTGVGNTPNQGTGALGIELRVAGKPAQAETLADEGGNSSELVSVRTRHKTH